MGQLKTSRKFLSDFPFPQNVCTSPHLPEVRKSYRKPREKPPSLSLTRTSFHLPPVSDFNSFFCSSLDIAHFVPRISRSRHGLKVPKLIGMSPPCSHMSHIPPIIHTMSFKLLPTRKGHDSRGQTYHNYTLKQERTRLPSTWWALGNVYGHVTENWIKEPLLHAITMPIILRFIIPFLVSRDVNHTRNERETYLIHLAKWENGCVAVFAACNAVSSLQ